MAKVIKWLMLVTAGLIGLVVVAVLVAYFLLSRSLPEYDKNLAVAGIDAPVEIIRNNSNVPHIFGQTDADSFFGLGYVHAQDRLWQMMMLRRTVQGRLSEVFGTRTLEIDKVLRRLGLYDLARQAVEYQDAQTQQALKAYAAGVNARLYEINEAAQGRGTPEMFVFNTPIAPWQPADSIALVKLMALQLSGHLSQEVLYARTSITLPEPERIEDILPLAPGTGLAALPDYASLFPNMSFQTALSNPIDIRDHPLSPVKHPAFAGASNAWAAAPKRSAAGGTLLANDPHLGFTAPAIWYLARMQLKTGGVIGGTIPGIPVVLVGRSENLGWGLTTAYVDDQDLYIEEINPEDPETYRTPSGFKPFETKQSIIRIKDTPSVTLTLRWTENGPVIPGSHFDLEHVIPSGHVTSLAWTLLNPIDKTMTAAMNIMRLKTVRAALNAAEDYLGPAQNITIIDQDQITMKSIGHIPQRDPGHESKGRFPSRGWIAQNRWQGRADYSKNPEFIAPKGGIVGNTNNKTVDRPFPDHVSYIWGDTQRFNRWRKLMQDRAVHTRESFIEAQLDTVSFTARSILPLIGGELWFTGQAAPVGTIEGQRQKALALLSAWNGEMNEHQPEPLIYAAWLRALQDRLIRDELGPLADEYTHPNPIFIERVYRDADGAGQWCDIRQSSAIETCEDIARLALDDALVWIDQTYGSALESLRWGDAHQVTHDHQVLGEVPVLRYFVNIRQSTSGGDNTLLRGRTKGGDENPFHNVHGAGYRGVYDFSDPDSSVFIISTGQSGHFLSRHYDDLAQLWRRGEYIPMSLDPELARAASVGITVLTPQ